MGAQPKKKTSHSRKNQRRSHDVTPIASIVLCSHCRRPHQTHHVCPNCGYYGGRAAVPEKPARSTE